MAFQVIGQFSTDNQPGDINGGLDYLVDAAGVIEVAADSLEVTEKSGTPNLSVDVAAGEAVVANIDHVFGSGSQAFFRFRNTAVYNVVINGNSSGNPRITSIFLEVDGAAADSTRGSGAGDIIAVDGTPAGSPTAPATPVSANKSYLRLADITVADSASSISNANITDTRTEALLRNDIYDEPVLTNDKAYKIENASGTATDVVTLDSSNRAIFGDSSNAENVVRTICKFDAYMSADQALTANTTTTVDFDTEAFDIGGDFDTSTNTFTAPLTGYYSITVMIRFSSATDQENLTVFIQSSNNAAKRVLYDTMSGSGSGKTMSFSSMVGLTAGDTIYIQARNAGSSDTIAAGTTGEFTRFTAHLLSI